jgi:hypothetical protein
MLLRPRQKSATVAPGMTATTTEFQQQAKRLEHLRFASLEPAFRQGLCALPDFPGPEHCAGLVASIHPWTPTPRFVPFSRARVRESGGYERHVLERGEVLTRQRSWHDLFNLAVWAHWPRAKWVLNRIQCSASLDVDPNNGRAPVQNVAAQFDECGLIVESTEPDVLRALGEHQFKEVFWERRQKLATSTRFWIVGHGSFEALLNPHKGLCGKAVLVRRERLLAPLRKARETLDRDVASAAASWLQVPPYLLPIPLLGIPGFHEAQSAEFYDDGRVFRPLRRKTQPSSSHPKSQGTNSAPSTSHA